MLTFTEWCALAEARRKALEIDEPPESLFPLTDKPGTSKIPAAVKLSTGEKRDILRLTRDGYTALQIAKAFAADKKAPDLAPYINAVNQYLRRSLPSGRYDLQAAVEMVKSGRSPTEAAMELGIPQWVLDTHLKKNKIPVTPASGYSIDQAQRDSEEEKQQYAWRHRMLGNRERPIDLDDPKQFSPKVRAAIDAETGQERLTADMRYRMANSSPPPDDVIKRSEPFGDEDNKYQVGDELELRRGAFKVTLNPKTADKAFDMLKDGVTTSGIAAELGVSLKSVLYTLGKRLIGSGYDPVHVAKTLGLDWEKKHKKMWRKLIGADGDNDEADDVPYSDGQSPYFDYD